MLENPVECERRHARFEKLYLQPLFSHRRLLRNSGPAEFPGGGGVSAGPGRAPTSVACDMLAAEVAPVMLMVIVSSGRAGRQARLGAGQQHDVLGPDRGPFGQNQRPLHDVFQLAHIARPVMRQQHRAGGL